MRIGITEYGDAGIDFRWYNKLDKRWVDGAILITKNANQTFIDKVMTLYNNGFKSIILHITCTGWGASWLEPNVPEYHEQLDAIRKLIAAGFPADNIVLRVDPIIPTNEGLTRARAVLNTFILGNAQRNLGLSRVRISIMDEYRHVKERLKNMGKEPFYPGDSFYCTPVMRKNVTALLSLYPQLIFETCAEDIFAQQTANAVITGCVSEKDIRIMGLTMDRAYLENPQRRSGCHCLACKTELLSPRKSCPHKCAYCFWKDK